MESIHGVFAVQSSYLALLKPAWPVLRMPPVVSNRQDVPGARAFTKQDGERKLIHSDSPHRDCVKTPYSSFLHKQEPSKTQTRKGSHHVTLSAGACSPNPHFLVHQNLVAHVLNGCLLFEGEDDDGMVFNAIFSRFQGQIR